MPTKRALIVDDSKTAQFKLKIILENYDVAIDSVFSAEDALSYLSYQAPDIIFMDHSMKGMSGLEAVKIIKLNPVTAVIPVVMYTAEKGDVYVGQARAVGAMEVLSKDLMTSSDIHHVMKSVNILEKAKSGAGGKGVNDKKPQKVSADLVAKHDDAAEHLSEVRNQVSRAIELQHSKIQRDIQDSSRMITRRLMYEVNELHAVLKQQNKTPPLTVFADLVEGLEQPKQRNLMWYVVPMLGFLGLLGYGIFQVHDLKNENRSLIEANQQFSEALVLQNENIMATVQRLETQNTQRAGQRDDAFFNNIVWAINQDSGYEFGEYSLNADLSESIAELLTQLDQIGFVGVVNLNIHSGNFCVVTGGSGEVVLPVSDALLSDCQLSDYYNPDPSRIEQTSFEFSALLNTNPVLLKGDISIVLNVESAYSSEYQDYPVFEESMLATQWNEIASINNKVIISLEPF